MSGMTNESQHPQTHTGHPVTLRENRLRRFLNKGSSKMPPTHTVAPHLGLKDRHLVPVEGIPGIVCSDVLHCRHFRLLQGFQYGDHLALVLLELDRHEAASKRCNVSSGGISCTRSGSNGQWKGITRLQPTVRWAVVLAPNRPRYWLLRCATAMERVQGQTQALRRAATQCLTTDSTGFEGYASAYCGGADSEGASCSQELFLLLEMIFLCLS